MIINCKKANSEQYATHPKDDLVESQVHPYVESIDIIPDWPVSNAAINKLSKYVPTLLIVFKDICKSYLVFAFQCTDCFQLSFVKHCFEKNVSCFLVCFSVVLTELAIWVVQNHKCIFKAVFHTEVYTQVVWTLHSLWNCRLVVSRGHCVVC